MNISTTFGQRLRKVRKDMGLNQKEIAKKLGFSDNTLISRFENDKSLPTIETIIKLAKESIVDLHWLITGEQSPGATTEADRYREAAHLLLPLASEELRDMQMLKASFLKKIEQYEAERSAESGGIKYTMEGLREELPKLERAYTRALDDIKKAVALLKGKEETEKT